MAIGGSILGFITIMDAVREELAEVIQYLKKEKIDVCLVFVRLSYEYVDTRFRSGL